MVVEESKDREEASPDTAREKEPQQEEEGCRESCQQEHQHDVEVGRILQSFTALHRLKILTVHINYNEHLDLQQYL